MAKTKISEFSATPGNNTDIDGINIAENCPPSSINNAIRELMSQLKDFQAGTAGDSFNGPVGTSTAAAGAFTTLTTSGAVTHNAGTANGVAYLNGSKVLTTGSALTFDGTYFNANGLRLAGADVSNTIYQATGALGLSTGGASGITFATNLTQRYTIDATGVSTWSVGGSEQMRLTSTGLGIGTSSPTQKLTVLNSSGTYGVAYQPAVQIGNTSSGGTVSANTGLGALVWSTDGTTTPVASIEAIRENPGSGAASGIAFRTGSSGGGTERMRLDSSGNLGLGVTPSAWSAFPALQFAQGFSLSQGGLGVNTYFNSGFKYITTGAATLYQPGSGAHIWYNAPSGTAGNAISFTQAMTLDASGRLLVGCTTGAQGRLAISGSGGNTGSGDVVLDSNASYSELQSYNSKPLYINRQGNNVIVAAESGNLLVGTTSTAISSSVGIKLLNDSAKRLAIVSSESANAGGESLTMYSTGAGAFRFYVGWGGTVYATSTSISAISDATLKENVRDLETGLTEVMALRPRRFDWKNGDAQDVAGFVAQEVEQVLPELVTDYQYSEGVTKKSLKMGDILPTLVKAIQEQQAIINALTARVAALESN
ncbi:Intramolecular chaperone auto-processing domain containing protein [uncultured Caudovirales phage]|uniref:Intramolecular chaperone auto-processing domain containing protein n=1 Tax=uncultured Caudovirales phage TaxID=2100421 RepID=A0A6J5M652_9CAUD|nr:Intramolecular chaperone auto-processing domain containing protein [uncultured Caudovirales phage]